MSLVAYFNLFIQYILPQRLLSRAAGKLANTKIIWIKRLFIEKFARHYQVDMSNAMQPELQSYACFNDFFTRAIQPQSRPIDAKQDSLCSAADGIVSQYGKINQQTLIQAKKHDYSLLSLLAGNHQAAADFEQGEYCTIYLAPKDYHRIHMPCDGNLTAMSYVPGKLFSVNLLTADHVPNLFAKNERVINYFDTAFGKLAVIAVGALIVGSIETVWAGTVTSTSKDKIITKEYSTGEVQLKKGQEMGRFKLGSTVILLMQKGNWQWNELLEKQSTIKMGEQLLLRVNQQQVNQE